MAGLPSIGDILMLSQSAWKTGRAFSSNRRNVPSEFLNIEAEASGLSKTLKLLAETLFSDDNYGSHDDDSGSLLISRASTETRRGVDLIISSCSQTLRELDDLVEEYQLTRRNRTSGGWSVERSWSELVLENYKKMSWTTGGGSIEVLQSLLNMHKSCISLTINALQSRSLARLEQAVMSMAQKVDSVHSDKSDDDLSVRIQRVNSTIVALANDSPSLAAQPESTLSESPAWASPLLSPMPESFRVEYSRSVRSNTQSWTSSDHRRPSHAPSDISNTPSLSDNSDRSSAVQHNTSGSPIAHRPSARWQSISSVEPLSPTDEVATLRQSRAATPPYAPTMPLDSEESLHPMPLAPTKFGRSGRERSRSASTTASQQEAFERAAFRDSAILCELRATEVEYLQPLKDETNPFDLEMGTAMKSARILIVRRRGTRQDGQFKFTTSIWALSDDNKIRMQQKLPENEPPSSLPRKPQAPNISPNEIIPFASYFSPNKVSIALVSLLRFHGSTFGATPVKEDKTSWVNYVFEDVKSATLFQSELFGRQLIGAFKTEKTLRLHDGLSGVLAYQEQMCGMESLRLWRDIGFGGAATSSPAPSPHAHNHRHQSTDEKEKAQPPPPDRVFAMIHYTAAFRPGYFVFSVNDPHHPLRIKDDGGSKEIKIRGLRVPLDPEPSHQHSGIIGAGAPKVGARTSSSMSMLSISTVVGEPPERGDEGTFSQTTGQSQGAKKEKIDAKKWITGARIEFATELEKRLFLEKVKEVQPARSSTS
ncbi:uncharacterized protein J3D65DRAFT_113785 [Phyllosticta citribraziliensis]|uniref:Uncharacterized protein n=1 Tax=Phyllosticta citribraziliensis TaxID=989973 RepID=A0ABR1LCP4_9PEZI